jgi:alpha-methylacyl-CoA racemase
VIEAGGVGPTPFCTMLLADMGADVVRVVRPGSARPQDVAFFARGKRAVEVDLKTDSGLASLLTLADRADVLVEGFRPGVAERLGFGPETVLGRNPRLVFARCTGWGQSGPMSQRAGHDINYIALSGALGLIGPADGPPVPPLNLLGDFAGGGLTAAFGIATALVERGASGLGQVIDASMAEGASLLTTIFHEMIAMGGHDESRRGGNFLDGGSPYYDVYETSDGGWFAVGAVEPAFYAELIRGLGLDPATLPDRNDSSQWPALRARFAAAFASRTRAEWTDVFAGVDACATPVLSPTEAYEHEHHRARAAFVEVNGVPQPSPAPRLSRTPAGVRSEQAPAATTPEDVLHGWPRPISVPLG